MYTANIAMPVRDFTKPARSFHNTTGAHTAKYTATPMKRLSQHYASQKIGGAIIVKIIVQSVYKLCILLDWSDLCIFAFNKICFF